MSERVLLEMKRAVALVTFNRPEKLNALSYALIDRLMQLLDQIEDDACVRAVILTGAGDRAFSAGADITEFSESIRLGPAFVRRGQAMTARMEAFPKPIIAAVNGIAFGGGCEITEAVHLAVASDKASFAKPEITIGIPPTFGGTQRLPRLAGRKRALEYLLTGDPFTVERALEMSLINRIVPHEEVTSTALELTDRILRHSPIVTSGIISAVTRGLKRQYRKASRLRASSLPAWFRPAIFARRSMPGLRGATPRIKGDDLMGRLVKRCWIDPRGVNGKQMVQWAQSQDVGDVAGHVASLARFSGLAFVPDGSVATVSFIAQTDYTTGAGAFTLYPILAFDDGSVLCIKSIGQGAVDGARTQFVGTLSVVGGKGRFEGVTGEGTLTGTRYTPLSIGADLVSDYTVTIQR